MKRAVVLVSGGLDSATTLAWARHEGFEVYALSVDYGQRHRLELDRARQLAGKLGAVRHQVVAVDLRAIGGSALTAAIEVPKDRSEAAIGHGIPLTYVPARNTIFLAHALAWAEVLVAHDIVIGVNHLDSSGYPDCRPEFIAAFERLARLATKAGVEGGELRVLAPLIQMTKADIVRLGVKLGVDYALTHSCYDPDDEGRACGRCDACHLRLRGFAEAGFTDPAPYQSGVERPTSPDYS